MKLIYACIIFILLLPTALSAQKNNVIIDADTDNELDDVLAIETAFDSKKLNIIGLTAAQWTGRINDPCKFKNSAYTSWLLSKLTLELIGKGNIPCMKGNELPVSYKGPLADDNIIRGSEAVDFIIQKATETPEGSKLVIVSIGSLTNVASAVMTKPEIARKIALYWTGMSYDFAKDSWGYNEFNYVNDANAFNVLIDAKEMVFYIMPNNVSGALKFPHKTSIEKLEGKTGIHALIRERWRERINGKYEGAWTMWDVALIIALYKPEWAPMKQVDSPGAVERKVWIYTDIDEKLMEIEYWKYLE